MDKPIFLMGFMSSGKSRLGKQLAKKLELPFIDLDKLIEKQEGKSINQLFDENGEAFFRDLESKALRNLAVNEKAVIALGGGTPAYSDNIKFIKNNGLSFFLKVEPKYLIGRLKAKANKRPLVKGLNDEELSNFVNITLAERRVYYNQADYIIESNKPSVKDLLTHLAI